MLRAFPFVDTLLSAVSISLAASALTYFVFDEAKWLSIAGVLLVVLLVCFFLIRSRHSKTVDGVFFGPLIRWGLLIIAVFSFFALLHLSRPATKVGDKLIPTLPITVARGVTDCKALSSKLESLLGRAEKLGIDLKDEEDKLVRSTGEFYKANCKEKHDSKLLENYQKFKDSRVVDPKEDQADTQDISQLIALIIQPEAELQIIEKTVKPQGVVPEGETEVEVRIDTYDFNEDQSSSKTRTVTITKKDTLNLLEKVLGLLSFSTGFSFGEKITIKEIEAAAQQSKKDGNGKALEELLKKLETDEQRKKFMDALNRYGVVTKDFDGTIDHATRRYYVEVGYLGLCRFSIALARESKMFTLDVADLDLLRQKRRTEGRNDFDIKVNKCIDEEGPDVEEDARKEYKKLVE